MLEVRSAYGALLSMRERERERESIKVLEALGAYGALLTMD